MKYNKISSILLLLSCICISLAFEILFQKKPTIEGARNKKKSKSKSREDTSKKPSTQTQSVQTPSTQRPSTQNLATTQNALSSSIASVKTPPPLPSVMIEKAENASKEALEAENKAKQTKKNTDITNAQNLRKIASQYENDAIQAIKETEVIEFKSAMSNPIEHIKSIKSRILKILNEVNTDSNKLVKIMNDIVLTNQGSKFEIITKLINEAQKTNILDSEKLVNMRTLVS